MKNLECAASVIVRDGKILLGLRNYREVSLWTTPGGRCNLGETPEHALLREIEEEIGVTDAVIIKKLGEKNGPDRGKSTRDRVIVFKVHTAQEPQLLEPEKFTSWKWFSFDELPNNLMTPSEDRKFFAMALKNENN